MPQMALTLRSELLGHCRSPAVAPSRVLGGSFPLPVEKENKESAVGVGGQHESVRCLWQGLGGERRTVLPPGFVFYSLRVKMPFYKTMIIASGSWC